ncbi:MAG: NYN domain-containing protein [Janthinobacterium lividum]
MENSSLAPITPPEPAELAAEEELPTPAEALAWLSLIKPSAVLALLKEPDFGSLLSRAFLCFRPDAKGFSNPLVRSRLAQAAAKDAKIAEKFRLLSETEAKVPVIITTEQKPVEPALPKPDPLLTLRSERDTRRRERDTARHGQSAAEAERDGAVKARVLAEAERDDAVRLAKKQAERIARLERQVTQAKQLEARLVKALNEDKVSPPPTPRQRSFGPEPQEAQKATSPWLTAVKHLVDKGKFEAALALAEDVLKTDDDNQDALEIGVRAWEGRKEPRNALFPARRLLTLQLRQTETIAAADTLLTLFRLLPSPEQAEPDVRQFLNALTAADTAGVAATRLMLTRLHSLSPVSHDWLTAYIVAQTSLGPVLMPPPGAFSPDDPLPLKLKLGRPITARHLTEAVDRAQLSLVEAARAALLGLEAADLSTFSRVWAALEQAASDDPNRLLALRRTPRGAAVVDGSNVAWFDQESLVHGRPRLRHLTAMRRALWARGFFPVVLYADANLPYFIDDKPALLTMRDRQELTFVDAGTVADEVLLRVAKQMGAPLITNDKMEDWDPEGDVRKVRYAISMGGEAHLLTEI